LSFSQYRALLQGRAEHDRDIALDLVNREVEALDSLAESVEVEENATLLAYLRIYKRRSGVRHIIERLKRLPHRVMLRIPIQWNGSKMDDPGVYKDAPWPWESALVMVTPTG
jgi:hypothetical protein